MAFFRARIALLLALLLAGPALLGPALAAPPAFNIGVVYWSMAISGQVAMRQGLEREAARLNRESSQRPIRLHPVVGGDGEAGIQNQRQAMYRFIGKRMDAIILQPIDSAALSQPVQAANQAQIPVFAYDQYVLEGKLNSYVTSNNYLAGYLDGEYVAHRFRDRQTPLRLVIVEFPYVSSTVERVEGFRDALYEAKRSHTIVGRYQAVEPVSGRQAGRDILKNHPRGTIDAIFCVNDGGGHAVMEALTQAGRDDVVMATVDGDPRMIAEIRRGGIVGIDTAQFMGPLGAEAMRLTYRKLHGQQVPRQVLMTVFPITRENLDAYPGWNGPIPATIRKPWPPHERVPGNQVTW
ncbi:D-ribose-binding periplasmic protein precursor [compost metagenome]